MRIATLSLASLLFFSTNGEAQDFCRYEGRTIFASGYVDLYGSPASLRRQNERADFETLIRISDDRELARQKRMGALVQIRETFYLRGKPDRRWLAKFRWLRANAMTFLDDFAAVFYSHFGKPLQVNSAVRTKVHQRAIARMGNINAAPSDGERASVHTTGAAMDVAKLPYNEDERTFIRAYLMDMEARGFIEFSEEIGHTKMFHIMVFSTYFARPPSEVVVASAPQ